MKKFIFGIIVFVVYPISAQTTIEDNSVVRSALDNMFETLDKSRVPTGLLQDYAVDLVGLENYNGTILADSTLVNRAVFGDILRSMRSASVQDPPFDEVSNIMESFGANDTDNSISIAVAFFKYNYIKANALTDGLIRYNTIQNKVYDVYQNNVWLNPYGTTYLFAGTASTDVCTSRSVTYTFTSTALIRNMAYYKLYFDSGAGSGYQEITTNSSVSATYTTVGEKTLKFKLIATDGTVLESHAMMYVDFETTMAPSELASLNFNNHNTLPKTKDVSYNGVSATITYHTAIGRGAEEIVKPFIVVEGFDPWQLADILKLVESNQTSNSEITTTESSSVNPGFTTAATLKAFSQDQRFAEYDLIYIDWGNSLVDIRQNAELLIQAIQWINQKKAAAGSSERNIIMGQSMGGLVARIALKTMENNGVKHQTSVYISHDTPHLGASVPVGAFTFIQQLFSYIHGYNTLVDVFNSVTNNMLSDKEALLYEILQAPSVQQMLYYHVSSSGTITNMYHSTWQAFLNNLGFPNGDVGEGIERLAIVNGGNYNHASYLAGGQHYLSLDGYVKSSFITDILLNLINFLPPIYNLFYELELYNLCRAITIFGSSRLDINAEINPWFSTNTEKYLSSLKIEYTKKFLWLFPRKFVIFDSHIIPPPTNLYYEEYPGSSYILKDGTQPTQYSYEGSGTFGEYNLLLEYTNRIMFIPTASALAIKKGVNVTNDDYKRYYYYNYPLPEKDTPFNAYYLCPQTTAHIDLLLNNSGLLPSIYWLDYQLNMQINGPDMIQTTGNYSVHGCPTSNIVWSTSNSAIATIDSSGKLTAINSGEVTITAESYSNGQMYRKTKDILVEFPSVAIVKSFDVGTGYKFTATATNSSLQSLISNMASNGSLRFEWSIIDSDGEMTTTTSSSMYCEYLPDKDEAITVALRLVDSAGNKGMTVSTSFNLLTPFNVSCKYVVIDGEQNVYLIKSNDTYSALATNSEFMVTFRHLMLDPNDSSSTLIYEYLSGNKCYLRYINNWPGLGNSPEYLYMEGTQENAFQRKWTFPFFSSPLWIGALADALQDAEGAEHTISVVDLTICNSAQEKLQHIPFAIIYKTTFPEIE